MSDFDALRKLHRRCSPKRCLCCRAIAEVERTAYDATNMLTVVTVPSAAVYALAPLLPLKGTL